jgi:hypothetical protein
MINYEKPTISKQVYYIFKIVVIDEEDVTKPNNDQKEVFWDVIREITLALNNSNLKTKIIGVRKR